MNAKFFCALCVILILTLIAWIIIFICALFAPPLPIPIAPLFLGCSLTLLILGPTVSYLAAKIPQKVEVESPSLTIAGIRAKTHPHANGSFRGTFDVHPPLGLLCVRDFHKFIKVGEIVHVDVFQSGDPSDAVHIVEKGLWASPEYFQIVEQPKT